MKPALLTLNDLDHTPIQTGDAGIVLRADGSFTVFSCQSKLDPNHLTPRQLEQGAALQAFLLLLRMPELMSIVNGMATDPDLIGKNIDLGKPH